MITRETVAKKLGDYLQGDLALNELVDWAEKSIAEGEFEDSELVEIVASLGLADVRAFGLAWEDCIRILEDMEDMAFVPERRKEPRIPHDQFLANLRKDGILNDRLE
jgi:hypothetical protein